MATLKERLTHILESVEAAPDHKVATIEIDNDGDGFGVEDFRIQVTLRRKDDLGLTSAKRSL